MSASLQSRARRHLRLLIACLAIMLGSPRAAVAEAVIPQGEEARVQALFAPVSFGRPLGDGWTLDGISIEKATVALTFAGPDAATATLVVHHPSNRPGVAPTGPVVVEGKAPPAVLEALRAALASKTAADLPWAEVTAGSGRVNRPAPRLSTPAVLRTVLLGALVLLVASVVILSRRLRAHLRPVELWPVALVTLVGLAVRLRFSPRTFLHEYYHAGDHLEGYLFRAAAEPFFYGETGPVVYRLANALMRGDEYAVFIANLVFSTLTIVALAAFDYSLFRNWRRAAFTAGLFALLPLNVRFAASEDLSNPAVLFATVALTLGVVFVQRGGWVAGLGAAAATSLAMHSRPEMMAWPAAVLAVSLAAAPLSNWRRLWSPPALVALAYLVMLGAPQALRSLDMSGGRDRIYRGLLDRPDLIAFLDPEAVPRLLVVLAAAGLIWGLGRRRLLSATLLLVAAAGAHATLSVFLNPPPYNLRTQMITVPTLLVLCGSAMALLADVTKRWGKETSAASVVLLVLFATMLAKRADWVAYTADAQQEWEFLLKSVPQLPKEPGVLLTVRNGNDGGKLDAFPEHLLRRVGTALEPRGLPADEHGDWPEADGRSVFYQGMYCHSWLPTIEPAGDPLTPRCARVHERYELEPIVVEEIPGPGYSRMEYSEAPFLIGFYRLVALRQPSPAAAAVPDAAP